jgi:GNAT superfamily N-acetyltransferase
MAAMRNADVERVRVLWRDLTDAPKGFAGTGVLVVASDTHRAAPDGWVGIVKLGSDVVVASPSAHVDQVRSAKERLSPDGLVDPDQIETVLHPIQTLGPALLFYGAPSIQTTTSDVIGPLDLEDDRVRAVLTDASDDERSESALDETTSGAFLALSADGSPAAVCGWREWPQGIAHKSSLTARSHRGRGLGRAAAVRALGEATSKGLIPQWRAARSNVSSIALARRLGLVHLGHQYSICLD